MPRCFPRGLPLAGCGESVRPGKAGPKGVEKCGNHEIRLVVQRVRNPSGQGVARQAGSEPCDSGGNEAGDA